MRGIRTASATLSDGKPDEYASRVLKYIPAEIVAVYVSLTGFIPQDEPSRMGWLWGIFAFCCVATFVYMFWNARTADTKRPIWAQIGLATIAFPFWAFALGGPFVSLLWYKPFMGSVALAAVTFLFGIKTPKPNG